MKRTTAIETVKGVIEFLENLPYERDHYDSPKDYARNQFWRFDEERYDTDEDYRKEVANQYADYYDRALTFNHYLQIAVDAVMKQVNK